MILIDDHTTEEELFQSISYLYRVNRLDIRIGINRVLPKTKSLFRTTGIIMRLSYNLDANTEIL